MHKDWRRFIFITGMVFGTVYSVSLIDRNSESTLAPGSSDSPTSLEHQRTSTPHPVSPKNTASTAGKTNATELASIDEWINNTVANGGPNREQLNTGLELIRDRRTKLKALIQSDPEAALASALTWQQRKALPPELQQYAEQPINTRGSYGVMVESDFERSATQTQREVVIDGRRYEAYVYGDMLYSGSAVDRPLNGIALDDVVALSESPIRILSKEESMTRKRIEATTDPTCTVTGERADVLDEEIAYEVGGDIHYACRASHLYSPDQWIAGDTGGITGSGDLPVALDSWSQGPKTLLFIRVNFPDDLQEPISESGAIDLMDRVNDWIVKNSYDTTSMISTITPLLTLPNTKAYYSEIGDRQLLTDARSVAKAAGYDNADYNLDAVRFRSVPGYSYGGKAYVRGKGCWLQSSSLGVACHEFGHNYGLWHANYWQSSDNSIVGPGSHKEYGDIFDTMGSAGAGDKHFSAVHRNKIDWMGDSFIHSVSGSGTYRIHAYDIPILDPDRHYAIKVKRDYDRDYWIELRHLFASYPHVQKGVLLRWDPWSKSSGGAHLLDTTPGSPASSSSKRDAPLVLGRTFSDRAAGIYITPVSMQGSGDQKSVDVVINEGDFSNNQIPTIAIQSSSIQGATGEDIVFTANANDPDGDSLAYYWTFGDLTFGSNSPIVTNSWSSSKHYVVRCRVSDMKGGYASAHTVVQIGTPTKHTIRGRITDSLGNPIEGVHVSNGTTSTSSYRGSYTDSDGSYVVANLSGSYTFNANLYGYEFNPVGGWSNSLSVGSDLTGIDFEAIEEPVVGVALADSEAGEFDNDAGVFRITRSGPTDSNLAVKYRTSGTASSSNDYELDPAPSGSAPYSITIPAGQDHVDIIATPDQDTSTEGTETVVLTLEDHSAYVIGAQIEETLHILDDETVNKPSISVTSGGTSADNRATESGSDQGVFSISRYGDRSNDVTVYFTFEGTALPGMDYVEPDGSIVVPAGESKVNVSFHALDDRFVEGDETVVIQLTTDEAYTFGSGTATVTIQDDDPTLVKVTAEDSLAVEGSSNKGTYLFQRFGNIFNDLTVEYTTSGTATADADFGSLPGAIVIPAGATSATLSLATLNDDFLEGDESVALTIQSSANYNIAHPGSAIIVIQDNELPTITLTKPDATASEPGTDEARYEFTRAPLTTGELEIHYSISGSALGGTDYSPIPSSIWIPENEQSVELSIVAIEDAIKEDDEHVTLQLLDSDQYNIGTPGPVSVTISDEGNSAAIAVGFETATTDRLESNTSIKIPVVLSDSHSADVAVDYTVSGGSAENGSDFNLAAGTLIIDAGETLKTINFYLVNDSFLEPPEDIVIQLGSPAEAELDARNTHTLTIIDDDSGTISVSATDAEADESGDTGTVRLARSSGTTGEVTVNLQISGTASSPGDYASIPTTVAIPDGSGFVDLSIIPVADETDELDETVKIRITSVIGGRVGSPNVASVTITDVFDEPTLPTISLLGVDDTTTEGVDDPARLRLVRSVNTEGALTVNIATAGDAAPGVDFPELSPSFAFTDGQSEAFIDIQAIGDGNEEALETLIVRVVASPDYENGNQTSGTVRIMDSPFMRWQFDVFSEPQIEDINFSGADADPDQDGLVNFVEYAFNRDPHVEDIEPLVQERMITLEGSAEEVLLITHQRRIVRAGLEYILAVSDDLVLWDASPIHFEELNVVDDGNGVTETVDVRALYPTLHFDKIFVDLRVQKD